MEASIARYGLPTVRRIFSDNGIRHVELEFLLDWHLDGAKRRASEAMYDRMLEIGAELGIEKIKLGGGVFEEGEPDLPAMRGALATICERAAPLGIDIVIEFLPFASINGIDRGLALFDGLGTTNGGLLVDTWHVERGGMTAEDIRKIPRELLLAVELDDAGPEVMGTLFDNSTHYRRLCGEGAIDIAGQLQAILDVGYRGYYGVGADLGAPSPPAARDRRAAGVRHHDAAVPRRQPARGLIRPNSLARCASWTKKRGNPDGRNCSSRRRAHRQDPRRQRRGEPQGEARRRRRSLPRRGRAGGEVARHGGDDRSDGGHRPAGRGCRRDRHADRHACRLPAEGGRARQGGPLREADRPRHGQERKRRRRGRACGRPGDAGLQPPLRQHLRRDSPGHRRRTDRRGPPGHRLEPRSRDAAGLLRQELWRHLPRHDHPRSRHGALAARRGAGAGQRSRRPADRPDARAVRRLRHGDGPAADRERQAGPYQQLPRGGLRLRPTGRGLRRDRYAHPGQSASDDDAGDDRGNHRRPRAAVELLPRALRPGVPVEMDAFIDAIAGEKPMPATVRDGVMALRLAECAVKSARTGRTVAV